jgi:hypothetical protein
LGEGRDGAAENAGKLGGKVPRDDANGDEGALVEIDAKTSCLGEEVEDFFEATDLRMFGPYIYILSYDIF